MLFIAHECLIRCLFSITLLSIDLRTIQKKSWDPQNTQNSGSMSQITIRSLSFKILYSSESIGSDSGLYYTSIYSNPLKWGQLLLYWGVPKDSNSNPLPLRSLIFIMWCYPKGCLCSLGNWVCPKLSRIDRFHYYSLPNTYTHMEFPH